MNSYLFRIRKAINGDQETLTELSFASKRYWQYPEHYYAVWQSELTITGSYLEQNSVYLIDNQAVTVGYYSMVLLEKSLVLQGQTLSRGYWLDHMFVLPEYIGTGLGRKLFAHLCTMCKTKKIRSVNLLADPYARGFYEKMGCVYVKDCPSTIEGRTTPLLRIDFFSVD